MISIHGTDAIRWDGPSPPPSRALELLFRAADLIVAPSWRFLRRCDDMLSAFSARRLAIHNGTDLAELELSAPTADNAQPPFILSVCSLDAWKGIDVLIRAVAIMRDAGVTTPLIVAGEGPFRPEIERLIGDLGLQEQVNLIGQQSRSSVARLLHQCTLFVLASRFETFGIAVLEAMACGKAVVGTTVDGIGCQSTEQVLFHIHAHLTVFVDGAARQIPAGVGIAPPRQVLHTPQGDFVEGGACFAWLHRSGHSHASLADPALRQRLGEAAAARVKDQFQRQRMGENYTHAFLEILADGV